MDPPMNGSSAERSRTPLVDVVIPVYNGERHLLETLKTVNQQDYPHLHVYVVDDNSSDSSNLIASRFECNHPLTVIRHPVNRGLSAARNTGISSGRGEYIAILDADDLWLPGKISRQIQAFLEAGPSLGVVSSNFQIIDQNGVMADPVVYDYCKNIEPSTRCLLVAGNVVSGGSAALIRRQCFQVCGGFDETLTACEDWEMWYRIACRFSILIVREPLVLVRRYAESMQGDTSRMLRNRLHVFHRLASDSLCAGLAVPQLDRECVACFRCLTPARGRSFQSAFAELTSLGIADGCVPMDQWQKAFRRYRITDLWFRFWRRLDARFQLRDRVRRQPFLSRTARALRWRIQACLARLTGSF
jgi:glycosyltransferase involved in cell wall biosynthesis